MDKINKEAEARKSIFQCMMVAIFIFIIGFGAMNIFGVLKKRKLRYCDIIQILNCRNNQEYSME